MTIKLYFKSTNDIINGNRNNKNPVTLFIIVCKDINCFLQAYPNMILAILIIAIKTPHIHNYYTIHQFINLYNSNTHYLLLSQVINLTTKKVTTGTKTNQKIIGYSIIRNTGTPIINAHIIIPSSAFFFLLLINTQTSFLIYLINTAQHKIK